MGAYLDTPKTEKETETGSVDLGKEKARRNLPFVVSSMQGWRKTMEDAHITATNLEERYDDLPPGTSLFAVFDGHGGKEVSLFCAKYFAETLVNLESFKARAYREAMVECFHKMDKLIRDSRYRDELEKFSQATNFYSLKSDMDVSVASTASADSNDSEGGKEGDLPDGGELNTSGSGHEEDKHDIKDEQNGGSEVRPKSFDFNVAERSGLSLEQTFGKFENRKESEESLFADFSGPGSDLATPNQGFPDPPSGDQAASSDANRSEENTEDDIMLEKARASIVNRTESTNFGLSPDSPSSGSTSKQEKLNKEKVPETEADLEDLNPPPIPPRKSDNRNEGTNSARKVANGDKQGEQASADNEGHSGDSDAQTDASTPVVSSTELDDGEADGTVAVPDSLSSSMKDAADRGSLSKNEALDLILKVMRLSTKKANPNSNQKQTFDDLDNSLPTTAGTTACVALIIEGKLYVANAGDSRAVLCRDTRAKPMSFDHKPEQPIEKSRIENAGGWVTPVGRVCGNLNLSRCIGDLKYKQNESLSAAEQVITAEPDVEVVDLTKEDLFLVIACDGVWDIMTNDMIVEFIGRKIVENGGQTDMKQVMEDVFDRCICDDPLKSEGKGGDNMTGIIVCLKPIDDLVSAFSTL